MPMPLSVPFFRASPKRADMSLGETTEHVWGARGLFRLFVSARDPSENTSDPRNGQNISDSACCWCKHTPGDSIGVDRSSMYELPRNILKVEEIVQICWASVGLSLKESEIDRGS
jgi:hypothetical protein